MRRWWCRWPVLLCGVVMLTVGTCIFRLRSTPAVNVLLITLDTTRADRIGCYQYAPALTPALDTLSLGGVLFERAYAVAPLTLPSHATLFTGLNPPEHGLRDNGQGKLAPEIPTLAKILRHRNYRTGAFVGSFVLDSKFGLDQGFEVYDDDLEGGEYAYDALHRRRSGDRVVDSALEWLNAKTGESFSAGSICTIRTPPMMLDRNSSVNALISSHTMLELHLPINRSDVCWNTCAHAVWIAIR